MNSSSNQIESEKPSKSRYVRKVGMGANEYDELREPGEGEPNTAFDPDEYAEEGAPESGFEDDDE